MKKFLIALVAMFAFAIATPVASYGGTVATSQDDDVDPRLVLQIIQKELPKEIEKGMTWESMSLADSNKTIVIVYKIGKTVMGEDWTILKAGLDMMNANDVKEIAGDDLMDVAKMMKCTKVRIIYKFPDSSTKTFNLKV